MKKQQNNTNKTNNQVLIYGKHPFFSVLKNNKRKLFSIFVADNNKNELLQFIQKEKINIDISNINFVSNNKLDSIFPHQDKNHQGYIIYASERNKMDLYDFLNNINNSNTLPKLLILDQILDPHNLGAIIRTACAFGVDNIIITEFHSAKDTATVIKTSVGLSEKINLIVVSNLNNTIKELKKIGYFIIGLDGNAKLTLDKITDSSNIAIILGNEGKGIRELVKKNCDDLVKIPMQNNVESLNVSVATAITLYQLWGK